MRHARIKVFTYSDPGGLVCVGQESVEGVCLGSRNNMTIYESPASHAYMPLQERISNTPLKQSPIRVFASGSVNDRLPDYVLTPVVLNSRAPGRQPLPGGIYLCQTGELIMPFSTDGVYASLSEMIRRVIIPFSIRVGATTVDIHLLACLSTGGLGVGSDPSGSPEEVAHQYDLFAHQQGLLANMRQPIPATSSWNRPTSGGGRKRKVRGRKRKARTRNVNKGAARRASAKRTRRRR